MPTTIPHKETKEHAELLARIEAALDSVRPYLKTDGGNVRVAELTDAGVLRVEMLGACLDCPMSAMTLRAGLEQAVLNAVPEVKSVEAINLAPAK